MKNLFHNIGEKMRAFMMKRNGMDELSLFLTGAAFVLVALSMIPYLQILSFIALAIWIWGLFRCFSTNKYARGMELEQYYHIKSSVIQFFKLGKMKFRDRKTHRYYRCPNCKSVVRIKKPEKGKKISICCPKCSRSFVKKV